MGQPRTREQTSERNTAIAVAAVTRASRSQEHRPVPPSPAPPQEPAIDPALSWAVTG